MRVLQPIIEVCILQSTAFRFSMLGQLVEMRCQTKHFSFRSPKPEELLPFPASAGRLTSIKSSTSRKINYFAGLSTR